MKTFDAIEELCRRFIERELTLEDFQGWLETVLIDDRIKKDLEAPMENALNGLEEAIYSCTESDPYAKGLSVVRQLLEEIALLKSKLQKEPGLLRLYEAK